MRRSCVSFALVVAVGTGPGCARGPLAPDAGPRDGGGPQLDAELDGSRDAGSSIDPSTCGGYAEAYCRALARCARELVATADGSVDRCTARVRARCEAEQALPGNPDLSEWRRTVAEVVSGEDCGWSWRSPAFPPMPPGLHGVGESCGTILQCARVTTPGGATVQLGCFFDRRPTLDDERCGRGVCGVPYPRGPTPEDCRNGGGLCAEALVCNGGYECIPWWPATRLGDVCTTALCDEGRCDPFGVCSVPLGESQPCDPANDACNTWNALACDPMRHICVAHEMPLGGEPCDPTGAACPALFVCAPATMRCEPDPDEAPQPGDGCASDANCEWIDGTTLGCEGGHCASPPPAPCVP